MATALRVLVLEDCPADNDLLARELRRAGFDLEWRRATTEAEYLAALEAPLDLILADDALPAFGAMRALQILRTRELDIPLIVVTESAGEEAAIECVRLGAADFLFKDRPARLGTAAVHALDQRELRAHKRKTEEALRESEERFRSAYEYAPIGMALVGLDGRWLQANRALCDFIGYTEQELLATTLQAITHPDDLEIDLANVRSLLAGEILSYQKEKRYFHKHGATIWVLLSVSLVRDAQGQPRYFVGLIQDITERKQIDAARSRLAAIVDASDDAIIGVAPDGTVMSWNTGAEHVYGYRADQMIGRPIAVLRPSYLQEEASQMFDRLVPGETTTHVETVRMRNDGQLIDVALTISAIKDASGGVSGFSTISRDISDRKRDDHVLRQKTAFIELFQEVAVAANQATSLDQALQTAVDTICAHIGWPVGHVYLPDPDMPGALLPTSIWHLEDAQRFATFRKITEVVRLAPGIGLPGQVMASRKPAWISDIILDVSTPRTRVIQDIGVRAGFALPVLLGDEVAAVLEFFAVEKIEPDEALLDVLHHVGTQLGHVVERRRGEAALRAAEAKYRTLVEQIPAIIYTAAIDEHSSTYYVSPQIETILGFSPEQWLVDPQFWLKQVHPDDRARVLATVDRIHASEAPVPVEYRSYKRDGRVVWLQDAGQMVRDEAGQPLFIQGIMLDITELKRTEEALRTAEAKYRALVEQIPAIIYTAAIDEHSSALYVSPQIEAILGYSPEEWVANSDLWYTQLHPDDRARALAAVGQAQASDAPVPLEYRSFTRDGHVVWLRDAARAVRDETGQPLFIQGIVQDITDRKLAEEALARYQLLSEHARDIILFLRNDGRIIEANQAALVFYGYTHDELLTHSIYDLRPPEARREVARRMAQVDNVGILYEAIHCRRDGRRFPVEISSRAVIIDSERVIVSIIRDISDRKLAEEALRASERLYRTLASNFPNGAVVLFDHDLRFTIADGAGLADIGLSAERLEGHTLWEVYPQEASALNEPIFRAALAGTPSIREVTIGDLTLVIHTLPVRDEHGEISAGMLMSQDITERKRMEHDLIEERALLTRRVDERTADLSAANAELARTARLKDEFLASMSHELRTPLNAVLGLSEALQEEVYGPLNDRQQRSLQSIEESGRHLLALINDMLDLAKIGAGKMELELEPVPLEMICQASLRLIKELAQKKQLSIEITFDPAVTLLTVDARRLKQILVNLLSNAVKFTPAGRSIGLEVAGDAARQAVDLTVWDTGIGIAQDQMALLFQPFVQLDSRLARQYEGTGLGLALVYRMVEMHGGSIAVTSVLGRGSRFTVSLPWRHANADAEASALAPEAVGIDRATIRHALIVEDSPTTAEQITRYLNELGVAIVTLQYGGNAVAQAITEQPDLIILDILLPDITGWEVLAQLKAEPRTQAIPVLLMSVIDDRTLGLARGAAEYLVKPVTRADIQRVLRPLAPGQDERSAQWPASLPPVVLLAEDNEANIKVISDYLSTCGYRVVVARNGVEAIARTREVRPAIVLMDIQMPDMDGLEATRRIRADDGLAEMPIITLTALAMPGDRERSLAAGANDYLSKPVSLKGLAALIEAHLRLHPSQQRNH